eukprot:12889111-Prorocentrum_lima.AAC.1
MRLVDSISATKLIFSLSPPAAANLLAGGGPGTGMLWARVPMALVLRLKNSEFAVALKQRLHLPLWQDGAPLCQRSASGHGGAA